MQAQGRLGTLNHSGFSSFLQAKAASTKTPVHTDAELLSVVLGGPVLQSAPQGLMTGFTQAIYWLVLLFETNSKMLGKYAGHFK